MTEKARTVGRSATSGRFVTTESNRRAAAKVYVAASKKAGKAVPKRIERLASGQS